MDRRRFLLTACAFACNGQGGSSRDSADTATGETGETGPTGDSSDDDSAETAESDTAPAYPCGQDEAPGGGWTELPLAQYPDLATVGGWYAVNAASGAVVVAHVSEGCYAAIQRACAHQGVSIEYNASRGQFTCPAHGAVYAADGDRVAGPQPTGLPVYPCVRVGDSVWVG